MALTSPSFLLPQFCLTISLSRPGALSLLEFGRFGAAVLAPAFFKGKKKKWDERKGQDRTGQDRTGQQRKAKESKGKERKGKGPKTAKISEQVDRKSKIQKLPKTVKSGQKEPKSKKTAEIG